MVIKQEVFVLLSTTSKWLLQHRYSRVRTSDAVVLALTVPGGHHGPVAPERMGGRVKDSPKHHWCHKGHSRVPAPGGENPALCQPFTADIPEQPRSKLKYVKYWGVPPSAMVLQSVGQYL